MKQSTTKRTYCRTCGYPQNVCICDAISPLASDIELVILQHPDEAKHAKNTVKLISLCYINTRVICGVESADFEELKQECLGATSDYWLLYPHDKSVAIESMLKQPNHPKPKKLILIDATWRKAHKIWSLNPWLSALPCVHFEHPPLSRYEIRKTQKRQALSTLEAASYALRTGFNIDVEPLYRAMDAMQQNWLKYSKKD